MPSSQELPQENPEQPAPSRLEIEYTNHDGFLGKVYIISEDGSKSPLTIGDRAVIWKDGSLQIEPPPRETWPRRATSLDLDIDNWNLSTRVRDALVRAGVESLEEVKKLRALGLLLKLKDVGDKALEEIEQAIADGSSLRDENIENT